MAQVFHPAAILVAKLCVLVAFGLVAAGGVTFYCALHAAMIRPDSRVGRQGGRPVRTLQEP